MEIDNLEDSKEEGFGLYLHIGNKIKQRRKNLKITQGKLAETLGITYQQLQKYESGKNKITVEKLIKISEALNLSPSNFYEGYTTNTKSEEKIIKKERTKKLDLMVIESNLSEQELIKKSIEDSQEIINASFFSDPEKAINHLKNASIMGKTPDILMLDINLKKIDGITLLREIKRDRKLKLIPVIIFTNNSSYSDLLRAYDYDACSYVLKPSTIDEMKVKMQTIITYWASIVALPGM